MWNGQKSKTTSRMSSQKKKKKSIVIEERNGQQENLRPPYNEFNDSDNLPMKEQTAMLETSI